MYPGWAPDLKFLQDLLGEVHDLSVLEQMIAKDRRLSDEAIPAPRGSRSWKPSVPPGCSNIVRR